MSQKASTIFNEWYKSQRQELKEYFRLVIRENTGWTYEQWYNKLTGRSEITRSEQQVINTTINERIFDVPELKLITK